MKLLPPALRRFLRSPRVIVAEVAGITLGGVAMALVPQGGDAGEHPGLLPAVLSALALDRVARSTWFLALVALSSASLLLVISDQVKRARRLSKQGSLGPWGSPLFHLGILIVILAGLLRMVLGADAAVDLIAGDTLAPRSEAWGVQRPGLFARPFAFPETVRLDELRVDRYPSGDTKAVEGTVRLGEGPAAASRTIAINNPIRMGTHSLYIGNRGGAAALLEITAGGALERHAVLLRETPGGASGEVVLADGTLLRASADETGVGRVPERIDVRVVRGGALTGLSTLGRGDALMLPGETRIVLAAVLPWVQLSGQRDVSAPVVYAGFLLVCLGGVLMFAVIPVESVARPRRLVSPLPPAFGELWRRGASGLETVEQNAGNARS